MPLQFDTKWSEAEAAHTQAEELSQIICVVPLSLFVVIALNHAGSYGRVQIPPVMYCLWQRAWGRHNDGLNRSVFFSQSIFKETNRCGTQKQGQWEKSQNRLSLYCFDAVICYFVRSIFRVKSKLSGSRA